MAKFKKISHGRHEGKIVIENGIIDGIVILAVEELKFVELAAPVMSNKMTSDAVKVTFDKDGVSVQVFIRVNYSDSISNVAFKVQEAIRHNVEAMTEYHVSSVNVFVNGVNFYDTENHSAENVANAIPEETTETAQKNVVKPVKEQPKDEIIDDQKGDKLQ